MIITTIVAESVRLFMIRNIALYYVCSILVICMLLSLFCFHGVLRKVPQNYIFLSVFTVLESYTVATLTCFYKPEYILYAAVLTCVMGFSLSLYACFSRTDFTTIAAPLFWVSLGISLVAMILMIVIRSSFLVIILCWIFLILSALYLIVDTQLIMGGKYAQITLDDYIIGAMMLFIDFISIFVYILAILGGRR